MVTLGTGGGGVGVAAGTGWAGASTTAAGGGGGDADLTGSRPVKDAMPTIDSSVTDMPAIQMTGCSAGEVGVLFSMFVAYVAKRLSAPDP